MKHENGYGSVVCLDKTGKKRRKPYAVRLTTGWKNGKQQQKYLGYYKTQAEARIALAEYNKPITSIKADHLQDWMDGIDLMPGSKKRLKSTMIQLYKYTIKNDILSTNYTEHIEINEKVEKTGKVFTTPEIKTLWNNVDNPVAQWILILIYTGMRIGNYSLSYL